MNNEYHFFNEWIGELRNRFELLDQLTPRMVVGEYAVRFLATAFDAEAQVKGWTGSTEVSVPVLASMIQSYGFLVNYYPYASKDQDPVQTFVFKIQKTLDHDLVIVDVAGTCPIAPMDDAKVNPLLIEVRHIKDMLAVLIRDHVHQYARKVFDFLFGKDFYRLVASEKSVKGEFDRHYIRPWPQPLSHWICQTPEYLGFEPSYQVKHSIEGARDFIFRLAEDYREFLGGLVSRQLLIETQHLAAATEE